MIYNRKNRHQFKLLLKTTGLRFVAQQHITMTSVNQPQVRQMRVYATPYAYAPNGAPLYIEYMPECVGEKRARVADDCGPPRKSRLVWTDALHSAFVRAVHTLGVDSAVPKQILRLMGVRSLTRENVASHLQKYRAALRRERERRRVVPSSRRISVAPIRSVLNDADRVNRLPPLREMDSTLQQRDARFLADNTSTNTNSDIELRPLLCHSMNSSNESAIGGNVVQGA